METAFGNWVVKKTLVFRICLLQRKSRRKQLYLAFLRRLCGGSGACTGGLCTRVALVLCRSCQRDVLHRDAMWRDVVDLPRRGYIHQVVGLHLDFVPRWQKGVEAHDEVRVTLKELGHSTDHTRCVNTTQEVKNQNK